MASLASSSANKRVVLAYSGGLDTTCILFWLKEQGFDVICYTADVGQKDDFEQVKKQAIALGAIDAIVDDRKQEFVNEFIYPAMAYGAICQGRYLLGTSLARPCISKGLVKVAKELNAGFIAHGATGKGNDQVRFELSAASLEPSIKCIAPWRLPEFYERFKGRIDLMEYAKSKGFTTPATPSKPYSMDANMMHISYESGMLEDPLTPPDEDMFLMTASPDKRPKSPDDIQITLQKGMPVGVKDLSTGKEYKSPLAIYDFLNEIGGRHGIGRIDIVEDRFIGMKSRGVYETPAGTIIFEAARDLETLCLDKEVNKIRSYLAIQLAEQVYNGMWFAPECKYTRACLNLSQRLVNGMVVLRLYQGCVTIRGRKAEKSLYDQELVSMDELGSFTPIHAEGFIKTQAVRLQTFSAVYAKDPYGCCPGTSPNN